jgi:tetratricopeptide (TPR) repeat protein
MAFVCVVGGRRADRAAAAGRIAGQHGRTIPPRTPPVRWPFERHLVPAAVPAAPCTVLVPDLHRAFPCGQTPGTRLVLTQSTYQLQRWLDWAASRPQVRVVAHASRTALHRCAPEAVARRGPWHAVDLIEIDGDEESDPPSIEALPQALAASTASERLDTVVRAAEGDPGNPALHLAVASAWMELDRLPAAQDALERAAALAPDWEAVSFEYGKLWLRADDLERAAERFADAARLMPSFSAALSNLGATLGETGRPEAAVDALIRALEYDPNGHTILNNLSVLCREQGRLEEAIDAGRRVTALSPSFAFGHYNLAHALFLQGRFADARDAYEEGRRRDAQKNPVQGCRLAVARAAAGDGAGAVQLLRSCAHALAPDARTAALEESEEVLEALLALPGVDAPELQGVLDVVRESKGTGL